MLMLLDEDCNEPITLYDKDDRAVRFEQVAIIPYGDQLYALLKPTDAVDGVDDDQAMVFRFTDEPNLEVVTEHSIIDRVFDIYLDLVRESRE